jgi:hypothetical protein
MDTLLSLLQWIAPNIAHIKPRGQAWEGRVQTTFFAIHFNSDSESREKPTLNIRGQPVSNVAYRPVHQVSSE